MQPLVPAKLELKDAKAQAEADSAEINEALGFIRYFLLGFGGIALFVGAFVIFNTLSITVAQRTREFATLRTLGGSRKQVMRSVVIEGFVIGLLASIVGLFAGVGIAKGLNALIGADIPEAGTVLGVRTVVVSLVLGVVITLVASIMPARRATRVPPIAAVREGATLPPSRFAAHSLKAAVAVIAASVAAISRRRLRERAERHRRGRAARRRHHRAVPGRGLGGSAPREAADARRGLAGEPRAAWPASWPERTPRAIPAGPRRPPPP